MSQLRRVAAFMLAAGLWAGAPGLAAADVNNGGFEESSGLLPDHLTGWDHTSYSLTEGGVLGVFDLLGGSWNAQMSSRGAMVTLGQTIGTLLANHTYTLTFDARRGVLGSNQGATAIASLGGETLSFYDDLAITMKTFTLSFTTGATATANALLSFVFDPVTVGRDFLVARSVYIDNVNLTATPVPGPVAGAGLLSLALAGAAWLGRRRPTPAA